jgi:hypothetical protein
LILIKRGFRLFTKFGEKGLLILVKDTFVRGLIGGACDCLSTNILPKLQKVFIEDSEAVDYMFDFNDV